MYEPITPDDLVRQEWTEKAKCPDGVMATLLPVSYTHLTLPTICSV